MIGIVIVAHGGLAREYLAAMEHVVGKRPGTRAVSIGADDNRAEKQAEINAAVDAVDDGSGVVVVTDMFGGTPSNISLTFLEDNNVEVISGVNLPMLLKLATLSDKVKLEEAVKIAEAAGRDNIIVASKLLHNRNA